MLKSYVLASFAALLFAACGSKGSSQPTTPPPTGGSDMGMGSGSDGHMGSGSDMGMGSGMDMGSGSATQPPPPDPAKIKADLLADEQAAYQKAKPVFVQYCAKCHSQGGDMAKKKSLLHFEMTSYPFGGEHAAEIGPEIRDALGLEAEKAIMPKDKPGAVKGDDLALVDGWAQAWIKADAGGAHGEKATKDKLDE